MRLGTLGDDGSCGAGFTLDPSGAVCLPDGSAENTSGMNLPNYAAESVQALGTPVITPATSTALAPVSMMANPVAPVAGAIAIPAAGCPTGYLQSNGQCVPVAAATSSLSLSSLFSSSSLSTWLLLMGGVVFVAVLAGGAGGGGRR